MTAIRQGAEDVSLVCLEKRDEMPAWKDEIQQASEEGVKIINGLGPNKFSDKVKVVCNRIQTVHLRVQ